MPLDLGRGFQFEFDVISEVLLPVLIIYVKNGHCKSKNVTLTGQRQRNDATKKLQTKIFRRVC